MFVCWRRYSRIHTPCAVKFTFLTEGPALVRMQAAVSAQTHLYMLLRYVMYIKTLVKQDLKHTHLAVFKLPVACDTDGHSTMSYCRSQVSTQIGRRSNVHKCTLTFVWLQSRVFKAAH
jgi:hypothetical protein